MKFEQASNKYMKKVVVYGSEGNADFNRRKIKQLNHHLSSYEVEEIDEDVIIDYITARRNDPVEVGNTTLNKELGVLSRIVQSITGEKPYYRKLPETKKLKDVVDDDVIDKVFNYLRRNIRNYPEFLRNYVLFRLILDTGLRISEVLSLQIRDVDLETNTIHLKRAKTNSERYAFFSHKTKRLLKRLIVSHHLTNYIFWSYKKQKPLTVANVQSFCYRLEKRLDLPYPVRPHKWRHTFADKFLKNGGDLETLRLIMGHTSLKTTQLYLHFNKDDLHDQYFKVQKRFTERVDDLEEDVKTF